MRLGTLNYDPTGKFVPEAKALAEQLNAEAVLIMILGSERGSGCCAELRVNNREHALYVGSCLVQGLRTLANDLESEIARGRFFRDQDAKN